MTSGYQPRKRYLNRISARKTLCQLGLVIGTEKLYFGNSETIDELLLKAVPGRTAYQQKMLLSGKLLYQSHIDIVRFNVSFGAAEDLVRI